jgi:hypothetical protein
MSSTLRALDRLEAAIRAAMPDWSLCKLVSGLMAMRGLDIVSAATWAVAQAIGAAPAAANTSSAFSGESGRCRPHAARNAALAASRQSATPPLAMTEALAAARGARQTGRRSLRFHDTVGGRYETRSSQDREGASSVGTSYQ